MFFPVQTNTNMEFFVKYWAKISSLNVGRCRPLCGNGLAESVLINEVYLLHNWGCLFSFPKGEQAMES